jgi:serine/threonine protein phosphatase 1
MKETIVIGDIHNGYPALVKVISESIKTWGDNLKFIFIGDYIDGWPDAYKTVQFCINLASTYECIFLYGNHDYWMYHWLAHGSMDYNWVQNGGTSTIEDYVQRGQSGNKEHLKFFSNLHYYYVDDKRRAFVHGGWTQEQGLGYDVQEIMGCQYFWNRKIAKLCAAGQRTYGTLEELTNNPANEIPRILKSYSEVYIGHTSTQSWKLLTPMRGWNVINVDTGSGWSGKLTAYNADRHEYVQSELTTSYYPGVKGRN